MDQDTDWTTACGSVKRDIDIHLTFHPFSRQLKWDDLAVIGYTDARLKVTELLGVPLVGYVLTMASYKEIIEGHMTDMSLIAWSSNKLKRMARSSLSAEIQQACNADDELFAARLLWSEINGYQVTE